MNPHAWATFPEGSRVFDTVTARDGVVLKSDIGYTLAPKPKPADPQAKGEILPLPDATAHESTFVQLDNGEVVQRSPRLLVGQ
jgi:hypothetical protein